MSERRVSLDLRTLAGDGGSLSGRQAPAFQAPEELDQAQAERFAAALQGQQTVPEKSLDVGLDGPFSLLGALSNSVMGEQLASEVPDSKPDIEPDAPTSKLPVHAPIIGSALPASEGWGADREGTHPGAHRPQLIQALANMVCAMAVSDGSQERRAVRVELTDSVLPGVSLSVYLAYGEWVADFTCTVQSSFDCLAVDAPTTAQQLSDALRQPACWLVSMDPPECDPVEARALPARTPTE